ncbi:hypothetical protein BJX99DRAFT_266561 [Aspergillus californicus]
MSRYASAHENPSGPGDARPTALQVIHDEGLEGKMSDKVFLITGCSSGIGTETARAIAATGARVFVAVRNMAKGQEACKDFISPGRVELLELDTSSMQSVRAAAATFLTKSPTLNVLICNAGVMMLPERQESPDGFEMQLATNYLGHWLLFWLLKDAMLAAAASTSAFQSRVVNVSSSGHHGSEIQFDDFNLEEEGAYAPAKAYAQSKLAQIYMANYLERHYADKGFHALSLMPGGIFTNLQQHVPQSTMDGWMADPKVLNIIKSAEQGAATTVVAAVSAEWEGRGGKYLDDCKEAITETVPWTSGAMDYAFDEAKETRLWELTLRILGVDSAA